MVYENLHVISDLNKDQIAQTIASLGILRVLRTNGTYVDRAQLVVPTLLSGFQFLTDYHSEPDTALMIAANSDLSMEGVYFDKIEAVQYEAEQQELAATAELSGAELDDKLSTINKEAAAKVEQLYSDLENLEDQETRLRKVLEPLAIMHPDRKVVGVYYNEPTPTELYNSLSGYMESLHKWGYGTDKNAPKIEGVQPGEKVFAFPFPADGRPLCHEITAHEDQSGFVQVFNLTKQVGKHGQPYLVPTENFESRVLFPVPDALKQFALKR